MATRYRLPEALGGGECHIKRDALSPAATSGSLYVRVEVVSEDGGAFTIDLLRALLTEVQPPPEPPPGYYLIDHDEPAYPTVAEHEEGYGWHVAGSADGHMWDEVVARYPNAAFIRLVPAEPAELPWAVFGEGDRPWSIGVELTTHPTPLVLVNASVRGRGAGVYLHATGARAMARALMAAADAAEKEQS